MEIEFYTTPYCLYHLEHYFCYITEGFQIDTVARDMMRICFYEAVTNAAKHGNGFHADKKVWIRFDYHDSQFVLKVKDEGDGFSIAQIPDPCDEDNLTKTSGRGLFFLKNNCTKMHYDISIHELVLTWDVKSK